MTSARASSSRPSFVNAIVVPLGQRLIVLLFEERGVDKTDSFRHADLSRACDHAIRAVSAVPGLIARVAGREGAVVLDQHPAPMFGCGPPQADGPDAGTPSDR